MSESRPLGFPALSLRRKVVALAPAAVALLQARGRGKRGKGSGGAHLRKAAPADTPGGLRRPPCEEVGEWQFVSWARVHLRQRVVWLKQQRRVDAAVAFSASRASGGHGDRKHRCPEALSKLPAHTRLAMTVGGGVVGQQFLLQHTLDFPYPPHQRDPCLSPHFVEAPAGLGNGVSEQRPGPPIPQPCPGSLAPEPPAGAGQEQGCSFWSREALGPG